MMSELLLLRGHPVLINNIGTLKPYTLGEIADIGENTYNQHLSIVTFNKNRLKSWEHIDWDQIKNIDDYHVIVSLCIQLPDFRESLLSALSFFLRDSVKLHSKGFFYVGEDEKPRIIDESDFSLIQDAIRKQNYLKDEVVEKEYKPANDKTKELMEKMKQIKQKIQNQNKNEGLNLSDIVSIVSTYVSGINIFNVWDLTVYQLYESYLRLLMWDDYHNQIYLLPHTAEPNSKDIKHWATKIQK